VTGTEGVSLSALVSSTGPALGLSTPFTFTVLAFDNYYIGNLTDAIGPMKYELDMPQFYPALSDFTAAPNAATPNVVFPNNAARESDRVTVTP
jgi:hypothetical protein